MIIFLLTMILIILIFIKKRVKRRNIYKTMILIPILIGCVIFGASLYSRRSSSFIFTKTTNLNEENISGLKLYESINSKEFVNKYGILSMKIDNALFDYYNLNDGLIIAINRQKQIIRITTDYNREDSTSKTSKDISLRSSVDDIIKAYGKNYYKRMDDVGVPVIGYVDKNRKITLEFFNYENKVTQIRYDITSME